MLIGPSCRIKSIDYDDYAGGGGICKPSGFMTEFSDELRNCQLLKKDYVP
jgi:hypothetical protein